MARSTVLASNAVPGKERMFNYPSGSKHRAPGAGGHSFADYPLVQERGRRTPRGKNTLARLTNLRTNYFKKYKEL